MIGTVAPLGDAPMSSQLFMLFKKGLSKHLKVWGIKCPTQNSRPN